MPSPNVDSTVIRLDIKENTSENVINEAHLFKLIRLGFSQRRKTLANPVSAGLSLKKETVVSALLELGLKPTARAEELTLEQFIELSNALLK